MKVAFVGYSYGVDPQLLGGHQSCLRRLASFLVQEGHSVDFIVFGEKPREPTPLAQGITVRYVAHFADAARQLRAGGYNYVQLSYIPVRYYPAAIRYLRSRDPAVQHGYYYVVHPPTLLMRWIRLVNFKLFYDVVIAVSPRLQRQLCRYQIPSFLLLPPVPDAYFCAQRPRKSFPSVTYMGRIDADKGVKRVIQVLSRIQSSRRQVRTGIRGYFYPHSKASLELHRQLQQDQRLSYYGSSYTEYSPQQEQFVLEHLRDTDVLFLPYETLSGITVDVPVLVLEAMAAGCVVVTTAIADLPEILAEPRLCLGRGQSAYDTITSLLESGDLEGLCARLKQRAQSLGVALSDTGQRYLRGLGWTNR